jgi:hypothetical protein
MTGTTVKKKASSVKVSATTDAQRRAAVILEVLAGIRTAGEAARLLKISPNSYYIAETPAAIQRRAEAGQQHPQGLHAPARRRGRPSSLLDRHGSGRRA